MGQRSNPTASLIGSERTLVRDRVQQAQYRLSTVVPVLLGAGFNDLAEQLGAAMNEIDSVAEGALGEDWRD